MRFCVVSFAVTHSRAFLHVCTLIQLYCVLVPQHWGSVSSQFWLLDHLTIVLEGMSLPACSFCMLSLDCCSRFLMDVVINSSASFPIGSVCDHDL